jgi:chromosome segregation ATPase
LQAAKQRVEQEVAAEVEAYKSSRRAEALQQLAGHLGDDTAAAAQQLEKQTAELQRLETAVADTAAVLQKLNDEVSSKQQQQQLVHSWSGAGEHCGDGQLQRCREQLAGVQQQLTQAEKQLAAADAALADKRAAVAEAEEQLAAIRRETSVCEPRLGSMRHQLQELESNIRARDTEHQVTTEQWASVCCWLTDYARSYNQDCPFMCHQFPLHTQLTTCCLSQTFYDLIVTLLLLLLRLQSLFLPCSNARRTLRCPASAWLSCVRR